MKVFDFNIHLADPKIRETESKLVDESTITDAEMAEFVRRHAPQFNESLRGSNFMLFNQELFSNGFTPKGFDLALQESFKGTVFKTFLLNFRADNCLEILKRSKDAGVNSIKFHSYQQDITSDHFSRIVYICREAEQYGMFICIDTSYGTSDMYRCDNLLLAAAIADEITNVPIILLHSGGARVLEAMLLAEDKPNIFLETSFSPVYYQGSSIENDFAFAYRKIGAHRVLYASDYPYIGLTESVEYMLRYLDKHGFRDHEIDQIMFENAMNLAQHV